MSWHRELESWVQDMKTLIAAVEMAKDVASAEATLQRHRERKVGSGILGVEIVREIVHMICRVRLMQRKTASRPRHSLVRPCSRPATLPQKR